MANKKVTFPIEEVAVKYADERFREIQMSLDKETNSFVNVTRLAMIQLLVEAHMEGQKFFGRVSTGLSDESGKRIRGYKIGSDNGND